MCVAKERKAIVAEGVDTSVIGALEAVDRVERNNSTP